MSMISELVDRLRAESKSMGKYGTDYMATLLMQAADTIVMLSEKVRTADTTQTENPCDGCVCDDGKHLMYCMNCKGIAWQTEPPKYEDEPQTDCAWK